VFVSCRSSFITKNSSGYNRLTPELTLPANVCRVAASSNYPFELNSIAKNAIYARF
jgi:hypothetical protein